MSLAGDPFRPTAELCGLLRLRTCQLRGEHRDATHRVGTRARLRLLPEAA